MTQHRLVRHAGSLAGLAIIALWLAGCNPLSTLVSPTPTASTPTSRHRDGTADRNAHSAAHSDSDGDAHRAANGDTYADRNIVAQADGNGQAHLVRHD